MYITKNWWVLAVNYLTFNQNVCICASNIIDCFFTVVGKFSFRQSAVTSILFFAWRNILTSLTTYHPLSKKGKSTHEINELRMYTSEHLIEKHSKGKQQDINSIFYYTHHFTYSVESISMLGSQSSAVDQWFDLKNVPTKFTDSKRRSISCDWKQGSWEIR